MEEKGYQNRDDAYDDFSKWLKTDGNMKNGISDLWNRIKSPFEEFGNNVSSKFNEIKGKRLTKKF